MIASVHMTEPSISFKKKITRPYLIPFPIEYFVKFWLRCLNSQNNHLLSRELTFWRPCKKYKTTLSCALLCSNNDILTWNLPVWDEGPTLQQSSWNQDILGRTEAFSLKQYHHLTLVLCSLDVFLSYWSIQNTEDNDIPCQLIPLAAWL